MQKLNSPLACLLLSTRALHIPSISQLSQLDLFFDHAEHLARLSCLVLKYSSISLFP
jgi:hypothetical protein